MSIAATEESATSEPAYVSASRVSWEPIVGLQSQPSLWNAVVDLHVCLQNITIHDTNKTRASVEMFIAFASLVYVSVKAIAKTNESIESRKEIIPSSLNKL
jgi:hypothetical protein